MPTAAEIALKIVADDKQASATLKKFFTDQEKNAGKLATQTKDKFKDVALNIAGNFSGAGGQIVESLGSIASPIAFIGAAAVGLGAALFNVAKRFAEGNVESSAEAAKFLVALDKIGDAFNYILDLVGKAVIPIFNKLFELIGQGASAQEIAAKQAEALAEKQEKVAVAHEKVFKVVAKALPQQIALQTVYSNKILETGLRMQTMALTLAELPELQEASNAKTEIMLTQWESFLATVGGVFNQQSILKEQTDSLFNAALNGVNNLSAGMAQFLVLGEQANFSFKRIAQTIGVDVVNALIKAILKATIFRVLTAAIPGFGGVAGGAGMSLLKSIGAFAEGISYVGRPTFAMIGESGPEAVVPLGRDKERRRNQILSEIGGGSSQSFNFSFPNIHKITQNDVRFYLIPELNRAKKNKELAFLTD